VNRLNSPRELEELRAKIANSRDPKKPVVNICGGTGCMALGCTDVIKEFREQIAAQGLAEKVDVRVSGCPGFCERGTIVTVEPQNVFYQRVRRKDVAEVVTRTLVEGKTVDRLLYPDLATGKRVVHESEVPFYTKQKRLVLAHSSQIDPENIEDYIFFGGYSALAKALAAKPEDLVEEVEASGLRGRGGGGSPPAASGRPPARPKAMSSTLSATATRATRAPSWTAASWKATRTPSSRA